MKTQWGHWIKATSDLSFTEFDYIVKWCLHNSEIIVDDISGSPTHAFTELNDNVWEIHLWLTSALPEQIHHVQIGKFPFPNRVSCFNTHDFPASLITLRHVWCGLFRQKISAHFKKIVAFVVQFKSIFISTLKSLIWYLHRKCLKASILQNAAHGFRFSCKESERI